jgi:heme/copper-type cytochrome/quinol oxidase subunit 4
MPWRCDSFRLPGNRHSVPGQAWRASAGNPILISTVIGEVLLLSFTLTAFWLMMAATITQMQAFTAVPAGVSLAPHRASPRH